MWDKTALYYRATVTYSTYPVINMNRDEGSVRDTSPGNPSPHPNVHCTAAQNIVLQRPYTEEEDRKQS